ncbi:NUDIX domain-containing protein [Kitasatospora sp. RB6PN24]|uniref:NUDIX hydrolase n=1 Tax=Kitasatospora humi TaxID=2893891 RepID=UPI001E605A6B|nr:NUDIX domain-containing protein [Kitasatospora humi]MCC9310086.1 NUDIX domain-containing protein [Kitasatospora humi]
MAINESEIVDAFTAYLERYPEEAEQLAEPARLLAAKGLDYTCRTNYRMHVTAGALLVRNGAEILLVDHLAYKILLQPGGHVEAEDSTLVGAALRELSEETGIDPDTVVCVSSVPAYIEYGLVPARPAKREPAHHHLDFGFTFETVSGDVGTIQESEVGGARWYPLRQAQERVGSRIGRAVIARA